MSRKVLAIIFTVFLVSGCSEVKPESAPEVEQIEVFLPSGYDGDTQILLPAGTRFTGTPNDDGSVVMSLNISCKDIRGNRVAEVWEVELLDDRVRLHAKPETKCTGTPE